MGKAQHTLPGMSQALDAAGAGPDIMGLPPFCKLRTAVAKAAQQRDECRIAGPEIVSRTKLRDDTPGLLGPACSEQPARSRIEQDKDENVAIFLRHAIEGENVSGRLVPRQHIPPPARDVSRLIEGTRPYFEGLQERLPG